MTTTDCEILLVEDNPDDAELALMALRRHNLANNITVLGDGATALDYLFCRGAYAGRAIEDRPRVVLLDLKLPKVDGAEVLRQLRQDPRTNTLPVAVLTSSREEPDLRRCYELGANSYIVKPVDFAQFSEAVRQLGLYWLVLNEPPPQPA